MPWFIYSQQNLRRARHNMFIIITFCS